MKTKEELKELKNEYETLNNKLKELTEDELKEVVGGTIGDWQNIEHSGIETKNQGQYKIFFGETNLGSNTNNENNIPLDSDERLKSQ